MISGPFALMKSFPHDSFLAGYFCCYQRHTQKKTTQHLNPSWTSRAASHSVQVSYHDSGGFNQTSIYPDIWEKEKPISGIYVVLFFHWFILGCINVSVLFWSYITQTGRASSSTACWWQTTPSLWEQAFNSMCNQFDGQPLSRALMNTAAVFHTCFYSVCARLLLPKSTGTHIIKMLL